MSLWGGSGGSVGGNPWVRLLVLMFILVLSPGTRDAANPQAHHLMSIPELRRVFQVNDHHEVPDYELIHIHSRRRRRSLSSFSQAGRHAHAGRHDHVHQAALTAFGQSLELQLIKNLHLVPSHRPVDVFFADDPDNETTHFPHVMDESEDIGEVYQDEQNEAALLLYKQHNEDTYFMDGIIGGDLVVKPAPFSVQNFVRDSDMFSTVPVHWTNQDIHSENSFSHNRTVDSLIDNELPVDYAFLDEYDNIEDEELVNQVNRVNKRSVTSTTGTRSCDSCFNPGVHIIYKRRSINSSHHSDYGMMETEQLPYFHKKKHSRRKRQAPFMIFPEILVIVDYDGYRLHGEDNVAIKRYVISFWNGVDLRYKLLKGPSVKISIAGIIISRGRDATPYLERNRVGKDAIDAASALTDMGKYLFLERRLPVYDIAVAITKLDMCRRKTREGQCNRGTAGFAYVGGACVVNKRLEKVNSVAIVEDTGGFSGIIVAAHELGHLLGAVHDGSPPPSYLGGPGAVKCRWEDGFIMSDLRHTSKGFKWSFCTVRQFHHFLNGETATCMYNSPHEEESLPRVLPGKLLSLDAQCRKDRGTSACFKDDRVCAQLFCFDAGSGYCVSYRPAAEGSRCGDKHMCLNGKCVSEHENAIDYGDGFLRRTGTAISAEYEESPAVQTTTRTWWNQITTPSSSGSTTIPWWKRLQEKTKQKTKQKYVHTTTLSTTSTTAYTTPSPSTTPLPTIPSSTSTYSTSQRTSFKTKSDVVQSVLGSDINCEDRITNIAGSMSCKDFLRSFAYQYCRHKYIKKNCCESHRRFCSGSTHGR